ncbi:hypothetical protein AB4254_08010 [Vibrio breoganii]
MEILGYQVTDTIGFVLGEQGKDYVYTEASALHLLTKMRNLVPGAKFKLVPILTGDMKNPVFEHHISQDGDTLRCINISTAHLSPQDIECLDTKVDKDICLKREHGYLIVLGEDKWLLSCEGYSKATLRILEHCYDAGYRLVQFDGAAPQYDVFTAFELENAN